MHQTFSTIELPARGAWCIASSALHAPYACYYYKDWRINPVNCFTVLKSCNCYYHYDNEKEPNFENMENWNSVGYDEREIPTCVPPIT